MFSPQERYAKVIGPASWGRHLAIGNVWRSCVEAVWKLLVETVKIDKRGKSNTNNFFFVSQIFID